MKRHRCCLCKSVMFHYSVVCVVFFLVVAVAKSVDEAIAAAVTGAAAVGKCIPVSLMMAASCFIFPFLERNSLWHFILCNHS